MEMHSQRSLYEIHGISTPRRRSSRVGRIARRAIARLLAILKATRAAIEAELAARQAFAELASMNDHMLRDLGIARGGIQSTVRRSRASVGTDYGPLLSNDIALSDPVLPTVSSPGKSPWFETAVRVLTDFLQVVGNVRRRQLPTTLKPSEYDPPMTGDEAEV